MSERDELLERVRDLIEGRDKGWHEWEDKYVGETLVAIEKYLSEVVEDERHPKLG